MTDQTPNLLRRELEPFLEMLEEKSKLLSRDIWQEMVNATVERITSVPDQYLTGNRKPTPELQEIIARISRRDLTREA